MKIAFTIFLEVFFVKAVKILDGLAVAGIHVGYANMWIRMKISSTITTYL